MDLGVCSMEDIEQASKTFAEILRFCGHRTAMRPFAAGLRMCVHIQAAMRGQDLPPEPDQTPIFGTNLDPLPAQRSLCHLRLLPEPKRHELLLGLARAHPLFTKIRCCLSNQACRSISPLRTSNASSMTCAMSSPAKLACDGIGSAFASPGVPPTSSRRKDRTATEGQHSDHQKKDGCSLVSKEKRGSDTQS